MSMLLHMGYKSLRSLDNLGIITQIKYYILEIISHNFLEPIVCEQKEWCFFFPIM